MQNVLEKYSDYRSPVRRAFLMHNFVKVSEIRRFYYGEDVLNSNVGCFVDSFENSKVEFIPTFHCLIIHELRLIISKWKCVKS